VRGGEGMAEKWEWIAAVGKKRSSIERGVGRNIAVPLTKGKTPELRARKRRLSPKDSFNRKSTYPGRGERLLRKKKGFSSGTM